MSKVYSEREAEMHGRRRVCYYEGHDVRIELRDGSMRGGVQGINAVCDEITCNRCDGVFTVTYPPIGQEAKP
mgnify:CR=1 FL=1